MPRVPREDDLACGVLSKSRSSSVVWLSASGSCPGVALRGFDSFIRDSSEETFRIDDDLVFFSPHMAEDLTFGLWIDLGDGEFRYAGSAVQVAHISL